MKTLFCERRERLCLKRVWGCSRICFVWFLSNLGSGSRIQCLSKQTADAFLHCSGGLVYVSHILPGSQVQGYCFSTETSLEVDSFHCVPFDEYYSLESSVRCGADPVLYTFCLNWVHVLYSLWRKRAFLIFPQCFRCSMWQQGRGWTKNAQQSGRSTAPVLISLRRCFSV